MAFSSFHPRDFTTALGYDCTLTPNVKIIDSSEDGELG